MNRYKKEELRKKKEARIGLSEEEIKELDRQDEFREKLGELAHKIHMEKFPEEYDAMGDSIADSDDRRKGKNPMSESYIEAVNKSREALNVPALKENGLPPEGNTTWDLALEEARAILLRN